MKRARRGNKPVRAHNSLTETGSFLGTLSSLTARAIAVDDADVIVAGGMESMSNAPYLSLNLRQGARMGTSR